MQNSITAYLEQTAKRLPHQIAYDDLTRAITFSELRTEAFCVASSLIAEGIEKKPIVVFMKKSVECIASFLGIAYSRNFYTPIDVSMPATRIAKITETLSPAAVVTTKALFNKAKETFPDCVILPYETMCDDACDEEKVLATASRVIDTDVLYILFTSGSTGTPKGVIIPHRSAIDYTDWFAERFAIDEHHNLGNQAPLYFDLSIQDVFLPIKCGCRTTLIPTSRFTFPKDTVSLLVEKEINIIVWIPTALCLVANLKALKAPQLPTLEQVLFCGEVMPNKQLNAWRRAFPETRFVNLYGPTEACDACTYYIVDRAFDDAEVLPMGKACENTEILVLDEQDRPVEGDGIGELCIRGTSLAYGYYNNPEKTAQAFVQNPLNSAYPEMIYRTGDLVRWNQYGELEFVSRKDFQIKHMGYRIELGEIESAAVAESRVDLACCLYDSEKSRIVLYYTGSIEESDLKRYMEDSVPVYMVPAKYHHLTEMPRNLNGKIDRALLGKSLNHKESK